MKPLMIACFLSVLGLASLGFAPRGELQAGANPTVGVVNIFSIQTECKRVKAILDPLRAERKKWAEKINGIVKELKEKKKSLENFEEGSSDFNDRVVKINVLQYRISELKKLAGIQTRNKQAACLFQFYREIERSVKEIAKARGLQLVFKFNSDFRDSKTFPLSQRLSIRQAEPILFFHEKVDITGDVIKLMNSMK
jgi:Skp family chaperone for outer membrane proteins